MSIDDYLAAFILLMGPFAAVIAALSLIWKRQSTRKEKHDATTR